MYLLSPTMTASEDRMYDYAKKNKLGSDDPRFNHMVRVIHDDGSVFFFDSAFFVKDPEDDYIWVFTEHHRYHLFAKDECFVAEMQRLK